MKPRPIHEHFALATFFGLASAGFAALALVAERDQWVAVLVSVLLFAGFIDLEIETATARIIHELRR